VTGSQFVGNQVGIRFGEPTKANTTPTNIVVQNNGFTGNIAGGLLDVLGGAPSVLATSNWWGNVSGPAVATNPYGTGDGIAGNIIYAPWLANGDSAPASIGFQPVPGVNNPPTQMVFTTQPGGATVGDPLSPQPVVSIEDAFGNVTPWANPNITLAIANNPTGFGVLTGTATKPAINGVATFNNLAITVAGGVGYTLSATDSTAALPTTNSAPFTINNGVPAITSLNPFYALAGGAGFTLTVNGSNFVNGAVVDWNGSPRTTTYVSATQVTASILTGDMASAGSVPVTVANPTPGGGVSAQTNFTIVPAVPLVVYVDTNYTGLPANTLVNWPYTGTGTNIVGYDAFPTIQGGVNAVASGGAVNVAAGNYPEQLALNKLAHLVGPNAGKTGYDNTRGAEALIVPPSALNAADSPREWSAVPIVNISVDGVSMDGFKISGDNPSVAGYSYAGMNVCAGLAVNSAANNVVFQNSIIEKVTFTGFASPGDVVTPHYAGLVVTRNLFDSIHDLNQLGYGYAMDIQGTAGTITDNKVTNTRSAMEIQPYRVVGSPIIVSNNAISVWRLGIYYNYAEVNASSWTITANQIASCLPPVAPTGPVVWEGIRAETMRASGNGGLIFSNTVDGTVALTDTNHIWGGFAHAVWGLHYKGSASDSTNVYFTGNTAQNVSFGFVHDAPANIVLTGNSFSATDSDIRLQQEYSSTGIPSGSGGTGNIDATGGNAYEGVDSTTATTVQLFAIEDEIYHQVDNSALGFVRVKAANVYVTTASGSIQRGIDAATASDTVNVGPGTFTASVDITKALNLVAPGGWGATTINGTAGDAVKIDADNVAVSGFTVRNPAIRMGIYAKNHSNLLITQNRVMDIGLTDATAQPGYGIAIESSALPVANVQIIGNLVTNVMSVWSAQGIVAGFTPGTADITGLVIASNRITQITSAIKGGYGILLNHTHILAGGKTIAPQIFNNEISALSGAWAHAIGLEGNTPIALVSGNLISGLAVISGSDAVGVQVEDNASANTVTIANNSFTGMVSGVQNVTGTPVAAASNWWGSASGPTNSANPGATGVAATGNVIFSPWLGDGTDTSAAIGFQPNPAPVYYQPDHLVFFVQPGGAGINSPFSPQPVVRVIDSNGGVATTFNGSVTIAINSGTGGAVLSGGLLTVPVAAGVATFSGLQIDLAGSYTLVASSAAPITSDISSSFDIANPVPGITSVSPAWAVAGDPGFTLTVNGTNFVYNSVVRWNGADLVTTYVSPTQRTAPITAGMISSVGTASVTVFNPAPGGGDSTPATSFPIYATPPVVYVDDDYTDGGTNNGHLWGYDAFTNIQAGINRVNPGGTVIVAAGNYAENVLVNKSATVLGPNSGIDPNTGSRVAEAVVVPATTETSEQGSTSGTIFRVGSNSGHVDVTIKGFTIDGHNSNLTGGRTLNGVEIDTGAGIVNSTDSFDANPGAFDVTMVVQNNIIQNLERYGVLVDNVPVRTPNAGNEVSHNKFDNLPSGNNFGGGRGRAVAFEENSYGVCAYNTMTRVNVGWQDDNYNEASPGAGTLVASNNISTYHRGIFHNLQYQSATAATIIGNNISVETNGDFSATTSNFGVEIISIESGVGVTVLDNNVTNTVYGVLLTGDNTTAGVTVSGGTLVSNTFGVCVTDADPQFPHDGDTSNAVISGVTITGATTAGVYIQSANGETVNATVTDNTVITGSPIGVLVQGTYASASIIGNSASITGNGVGISVDTGKALVQDNDLTGNSVAAISVTNNAIVDAGNCGADVTGLGVSTGGNNLSGYGFDNAAPWAILNQNSGGVPQVLAEHDNFGAGIGADIPAAFSPATAVVYSQSPAVLAAPTNVTVVCASGVPVGATSLAGLYSQGGYFSAGVATVTYSDDTNFTGSGVITRTYVVADSCGVMSTNTQTITVSDTVPPNFTLVPANMVLSADLGECSKSNVTWTVTASDNCLPPAVVSIPPSGSTFEYGTTTVTNIAMDASGNITISNFTVTVQDTQPPSANVPANIVTSNDPGVCGAVVTFSLPSQTDNCGVASTNVTPPSGSTFDVGTNVVTVVVTDIHGNTATNTFTVTVNDVQAPVIQPIANIVKTNDVGSCSALITYAMLTATDNCAVASIVATPPSGSPFNVGTNTVVVVATDIHGNTSTNGFSVTVQDVEPPSANVPTNIVQGVDVGQSYATVNFTLSTQTDNCGVAGQVATPSSGSTFNVGTNTVTVVVTDIHSNTATNTFTVAVIALPHIVTQPASRTNNAGTTATFTVVASSPSVLTYQWLKGGSPLSNAGNISGATNATLTIANVQDSDATNYTVQVSNLAGTVTSSNATLTVIDAPVITSISPSSQTNKATTTAVFTVSATGTTPFAYQWSKITPTATNVLTDGGNISGSTTNVLTITNVLAADQAIYAVSVSNPAGTANTNGSLFVIDPAIFVQPVNVTNVLGGPASFSVTAAGTAPLSYQWYQDDVLLPGKTASTLSIASISDSDEGGYTVIVTNSAGFAESDIATLTITHPPVITIPPMSQTVNQGTNVLFTVSANGTTPFHYQWRTNGVDIAGANGNQLVLLGVTLANEAAYTVFITNVDGSTLSTPPAILTVIVPPAITSQPIGLTTNAGSAVSFSVTSSGTAPIYQWRKNGTNLTDGVNISGSTSNVLTLASVFGADDANYSLVASNQAGVAISSNATLVVIDPIITSQPVSVTTNAGSTATFTVGYIGTTPGFQWYKGVAPIPSATSATLVLSGVSQSDATSYHVVLSNSFGNVTSSNATLTVIDPPVITSQPAGRTNNAGTTATFTVGYTGTAPNLQWYKGVNPISNQTNATLTLNNVSQSDATNYSVTLSNAAGTTNSAAATLTVIDAPVITSQPASRTNNAGTTATFTVGYTGTAPTFQWYKGVNPISNQTNATLTLNSVSQSDATNYSVILSNAAGTTNSAAATLTVIDAPVITSQPASQTNIALTSVTFSVNVSGTAPFAYQWSKVTPTATNLLSNGGNVSGATSSNLTIVNLLAVDQASYFVTVTNPAGSTISSNAALVVIDPAVVVPPMSVTNIVGSTVTFTVTAVGTAPLGYQWQFGGSPLFGQTASNLVINSIANSDAGTYTVVVTNSVGSVTSAPAFLVTVPPLITSQPTNLTVIQGQPASFSVTVNGQTPFTYQWQLNSNNISGATNRIYALIAATNSTDAGSYRVIVSNPQGTQISSNAILTVVVPPAITQQPTNVIAVVGDNVSFSVTATGTPLFYQWHLSNTNLPSANSATLTLNSVTTNSSGTYSVTVTNIGGSVTSSNVTLAVYPTLVPVVATISYTNHQFTMTLTGVPTYNYVIQGSSNLLDWVSLVTNASPFTYVDTNRMDNRFYRGQYQQP
jgi:hypothetical protein